MSGDRAGLPRIAPLASLPRRSPLALLVEAQRGRAPVNFFDPHVTLAATLEAAAQHLAAACYAADAYSRDTGATIDIGDEVRRAITVLSTLSWTLLAQASPAPACAGSGVPGERRGVDGGVGDG